MFSKTQIDKISQMASYFQTVKYTNHKYSKMFTTPITQKVTDIMDTIVDNNRTGDVQYLGLSGESFNIAAFLGNLNFTRPSCLLKRDKNSVSGDDSAACLETEPYSNNLIFELASDKETEEYFVKMLYNGIILDLAAGGNKTVDLNGEEVEKGYISFKDFKTLASKKLITDEYHSLCLSGNKNGVWFIVIIGLFISTNLIMTGYATVADRTNSPKTVNVR